MARFDREKPRREIAHSRVYELPRDWVMRSVSTKASASSALRCSWKRWRRAFVACATPAEKHGMFDSRPIMLTRSMMLSAERRNAREGIVSGLVERALL